MQLIELRNVSKRYPNGVTALADIDLEISKGEFVFIMGASGSGKSTIIKLLYRQEKPSGGEVFVGGANVAKLRNGKVYKLRRKLGIVFQDYKLLPKLTAYENVAFALEMYGYKKSEIRKATIKALENVGLKDKLKYFKKAGLNLDGLYFICFIMGFILLLIYIVKVLRRLARNIRINSYNRS